MKDAADYLLYIRSVILLDDQVQHWQIMREEAQSNTGLLRYRLLLHTDDVLDIFERFTIEQGKAFITRYSYHWQRANQQFVKRWDNTPHYPAIATHPHHLHDGDENNVLPHPSIKLTDVLTLIRQTIA